MTNLISSLDAPLIKPSEDILATLSVRCTIVSIRYQFSFSPARRDSVMGVFFLNCMHAVCGNGSDATLNRIGLLLGTGLLVLEAESTNLETTLTLLGRRCAFSA
jgi:hypothetical protein